MILREETFLVLWISSVLNPVELKVASYRAASKLHYKYFSLISSEGALVAIAPYDYPAAAAARPLFEHTPVLDNNFSINAMKTLVTMITMIAKIT